MLLLLDGLNESRKVMVMMRGAAMKSAGRVNCFITRSEVPKVKRIVDDS